MLADLCIMGATKRETCWEVVVEHVYVGRDRVAVQHVLIFDNLMPMLGRYTWTGTRQFGNGSRFNSCPSHLCEC